MAHVLIISLGIILVLTGVKKWKWFFYLGRRNQALFEIIGMTGYQITCVVLGLLCIVTVIIGLLKNI